MLQESLLPITCISRYKSTKVQEQKRAPCLMWGGNACPAFFHRRKPEITFLESSILAISFWCKALKGDEEIIPFSKVFIPAFWKSTSERPKPLFIYTTILTVIQKNDYPFTQTCPQSKGLSEPCHFHKLPFKPTMFYFLHNYQVGSLL